jgi:hypothetical protein
MNREDEILEKLSRIERGIYGDAKNKTEGLLDKVNKHDELYYKMAFFLNRPKFVIWLGVILLYLAIYLSHKGIDSILQLIP